MHTSALARDRSMDAGPAGEAAGGEPAVGDGVETGGQQQQGQQQPGLAEFVAQQGGSTLAVAQPDDGWDADYTPDPFEFTETDDHTAFYQANALGNPAQRHLAAPDQPHIQPFFDNEQFRIVRVGTDRRAEHEVQTLLSATSYLYDVQAGQLALIEEFGSDYRVPAVRALHDFSVVVGGVIRVLQGRTDFISECAKPSCTRHYQLYLQRELAKSFEWQPDIGTAEFAEAARRYQPPAPTGAGADESPSEVGGGGGGRGGNRGRGGGGRGAARRGTRGGQNRGRNAGRGGRGGHTSA